jgi:hypothetical protein
MPLACMAIQQPFADLVVRGVKDVENRGSAMPSTLRGQWCAIYASKTLAPVPFWIEAMLLCSPDYAATGRIPSPERPATHWPWTNEVKAARKQCTRGAIVGLVRWASSTQSTRRNLSPWAQPGAHHWAYSDRILLAEPVPLPDGGRQNLNWYLDEEVTAAVLAARPTNGALYKPERKTVADVLVACEAA